MKKIAIPGLFLIATVLSFVMYPTPSTSHQGAKGIVKERMELMKSIGKSMKRLSAMVRGKTPLDRTSVVKSTRAIEEHGQKIPALFPAGSGHGVSEAAPRIWQDPEGFKAASDRMIDAARIAAKAAGDIDSLKPAFRALGKTCSGCHKQFRIKKKRR